MRGCGREATDILRHWAPGSQVRGRSGMGGVGKEGAQWRQRARRAWRRGEPPEAEKRTVTDSKGSDGMGCISHSGSAGTDGGREGPALSRQRGAWESARTDTSSPKKGATCGGWGFIGRCSRVCLGPRARAGGSCRQAPGVHHPWARLRGSTLHSGSFCSHQPSAPRGVAWKREGVDPPSQGPAGRFSTKKAGPAPGRTVLSADGLGTRGPRARVNLDPYPTPRPQSPQNRPEVQASPPNLRLSGETRENASQHGLDRRLSETGKKRNRKARLY